MRRYFLSPLLGLLITNLVQGQGGSGVISLVMPPPGGEGFSMLQSGGPFANGATASYYNPALLADISRHTGSQLHYTRSKQDLLPFLGLPHLYQHFSGVAMAFPEPKSGTDVGLGLFRNHVSFGKHEWIDGARQTRYWHAYESAYGAAIGVRLGLPISVGGAVKFFDSRLGPEQVSSSGARSSGSAQGWAFDLGTLLHPRWRPLASLGLATLEAAPSISLAVRNLGPDVFYADPSQADPLPTTLSRGVGIRLGVLDLVDFQAGWTLENEIHRRAEWSWEPVHNHGFSVDFLFYRYSRGRLEDSLGVRDEEHIGESWEIDLLRAYRIGKRFSTGDFQSPPEVLEAGFPFGWLRVFGLSYRANPRIVIGRREIKERRMGLRHGQKASFVAFSL